MSLYRARELDTSPPEWTVGDNSGASAGMIPGIGTGFAWGPRTAGKSLVFGVELGLAVANGVPFFGFPTQRGKVVYCAGEGIYDLGLRFKARQARQARDDTLAIAEVAKNEGDEAARAYAASLPPYTDDNLFIMDKAFTIPLINPSRAQTDSLKKAITTIQRLNTPGPDDDPDTFLYVQLVIVDPMAKFTGRSMSNDSSATLISSGLQAMSNELNTFVLAIAHPTEQGQKMLGAGALLNLADTEIEVRPDETNPNALRTASVLSHKSKYSALFEPIAYQVEPCEWDEPELDELDEPTGKTVRVRSATVRMLEEGKPAAAPGTAQAAAPPSPLPEIRDVEQPNRKRTGLKRHGLHAVPDAGEPAPPGIKPLKVLASDADAKREVVHTILAQHCEICSRQGGVGCDQKMTPKPLLLGRSLSGPLYAHEDRVIAAMSALPDQDQEGFLNAALVV